MMSSRIAEIVIRREELIVRAAAQRAQIAAAASRLRPSLWFANLAVRAYRLIKLRPLWAALVLGVLAVAGPRRALRWAYRGVSLYATVVPLAKVFAELLQRLRAVR
ncbi:MAG TPA: YqjK family protein [Burkholderiales bacterium]|jgi:hypothetical protein|nr:YqjK family protein [Burkholderiales bacterium]